MATRKFSKATPIYVSVPPKMSIEQTHEVTKKILGLVGCPGCYSGFHFNFIDETEMITAHIDAKGINVGPSF
ncbi:MAG: hypothetical protein JWR09_4305 [Mucilaginibacter sp.]|nr:hypothetical protein [Mucilaginibacter sp.]